MVGQNEINQCMKDNNRRTIQIYIYIVAKYRMYIQYMHAHTLFIYIPARLKVTSQSFGARSFLVGKW